MIGNQSMRGRKGFRFRGLGKAVIPGKSVWSLFKAGSKLRLILYWKIYIISRPGPQPHPQPLCHPCGYRQGSPRLTASPALSVFEVWVRPLKGGEGKALESFT